LTWHQALDGRVRILSLLFALAVLACAQDVLTNESVVKMVKAGLSERVILSMVSSQPPAYSVTPDTLIELKSAGVSDRIVAAMVERNAGAGPVSPNPTVATGNPNDPTTPHDSGIYLYSKDRNGEYKMTVLEQAAYQGSKMGGVLSTALTYGIKKAKMKAVIPGQHAGIRTLDPQPVFYFYFEDRAAGLGKGAFGAGSVSNPNQFALVKLTITKTSRETIIGEFGLLGSSTGTNEKSMVTFTSERLRAGLYKVLATGPMDGGEYCFLVSQINIGAFGAGAAGASQIFDFAVAPN
jgi:hypothetical protein